MENGKLIIIKKIIKFMKNFKEKFLNYFVYLYYLFVLVINILGFLVIFKILTIGEAEGKIIKNNEEYQKRMVRVIDGDTFEIDTDNESDLIKKLKLAIRIKNIDTPEIGKAKKPCEKLMGLEAKKFLEKFFENKKIVKLKNIKWDKFGGRIASDVEVDGISVGKMMIEKGFAVYYEEDKPKSKIWC
jgi:endonuclease YncB( thermonuclease family)